MRGATGLDTQGERSISLPECLGTGPDRSLAHKQDSCESQGNRSLGTVTPTSALDSIANRNKLLNFRIRCLLLPAAKLLSNQYRTDYNSTQEFAFGFQFSVDIT